MEDDAERMAPPAAQTADAMAQLDAIAAARAAHRAMVNGKGDGIALAERHDLDPALHARALLGQHKLAAGEIAPRLRQQDRHLVREGEIAIEILVQAIEITRPILEEER